VVPSEMSNLTVGLTTKADKMRVLERHGVSRADIARFLNVRYQQVRNTLEGDKRTGYSPQLNIPLSRVEVPDGNSFVVLDIRVDGSAVLESELLESIPGDSSSPIVAVRTKHGLFITSIDGAMARLSETI
jgi:hypothetical protein